MLSKYCAVPGSVKTNHFSSAWAIHMVPRLTRSRATPRSVVAEEEEVMFMEALQKVAVGRL